MDDTIAVNKWYCGGCHDVDNITDRANALRDGVIMRDVCRRIEHRWHVFVMIRWLKDCLIFGYVMMSKNAEASIQRDQVAIKPVLWSKEPLSSGNVTEDVI